MDESAIEQLQDLGFPRERIVIALNACGHDAEVAAQFIVDNSDQTEQWWARQVDVDVGENDANGKRTKTMWAALAQLQENTDETFESSSKVLEKVLDNIMNNPVEEKFRILKLDKARIQKDIVNSKGSMAALLAVGWVQDGDSLVLPADADVEPVEELRDAIRAARISREESKSAAPTSIQPEQVDAVRLERTESASADFVRNEYEEVAAEKVREINNFCAVNQTQFVDDQFPPINRSLYTSEEWATQWKCFQCNSFNPLPPPAPKEVAMFPIPRAPLVCASCKSPAPRIAVQARPMQWLRPRDIRDDVTMQIGGAAWTVFREEPRSDDVRQGALGNCWFVGALSVVAERPDLIRNMFLGGSDQINPNGAYQLRLCRDGLWHVVLVDDLFPCTNLDMLAYSKAARRQIWVPLVEKAAAKLFKCYQHLSSGTLSEALTQFTGYATDQIFLGGAGQFGNSPEAKTSEAIAALVTAHAAEFKEDEIWAKLMKAKELGFIMGTACVGRSDTKEKDLGLQAPHAYAVLDIREVAGFRLAKLRNPWGIESWKGDWSPNSKKWTEFPAIKDLLKPEREDGGVFWVTWEDWREYFASCEICRVRNPEWTEIRSAGFWLPSAVGLGDAVEFSCFVETDVDIAIYQEGHMKRQANTSHMMDLGFGILRKDDDGESYTLVDDTVRKMQPLVSKAVCLQEGTYLVVPICFNQLAVPEPRKYVFATHSSQPLLIEKKACEPRWLSEVMIQRTMKHGTRREIVPASQGPVCTYIYSSSERDGECGITVVAENKSPYYCLNVGLDCGESPGMVSSRGTLISQDVIGPNSRALLFVLSPMQGAEKYGYSLQQSFDITQGGVEMHIPELDPQSRVDQIHQAIPHTGPANEQSTLQNSQLSDILRNIQSMGQNAAAQPRTVPATVPAAPGSAADTEMDAAAMEEEMLQAAIRASLGDSSDPGTGGSDKS